MKFILGKKMNMTQVWEDDKVVAATPILAGPCTISQVRTKDKDGYSALQLAFGQRKEKNIKKPQLGHFKKSKVSPQHVREFRIDETGEIKVGDIINVATFAKGDKIIAVGTSKGKGFQGVVKKYGFKGQSKTHGTKDQVRMPGSIGSIDPAHVFKGMKMGGRTGGKRISVANLEIIKVDLENNILYIKGALPGAVNGLVMIKGQGELKVNIKPEKKQEEKQEDKQEVETGPEKEENKEESDKKEEGKEEKKQQEKTEDKKEEKQEDKEVKKEEKAETTKEEDKDKKEA